MLGGLWIWPPWCGRLRDFAVVFHCLVSTRCLRWHTTSYYLVSYIYIYIHTFVYMDGNLSGTKPAKVMSSTGLTTTATTTSIFGRSRMLLGRSRSAVFRPEVSLFQNPDSRISMISCEVKHSHSYLAFSSTSSVPVPECLKLPWVNYVNHESGILLHGPR